MGDLAEVVEDLICTFEGTSDTTMDTFAMLIFGWFLIALFILWLGKIIYKKFFNKKIYDNKNEHFLSSNLQSKDDTYNKKLTSSSTSSSSTTTTTTTIGGGGGGVVGGGGAAATTTTVIRSASGKNFVVPSTPLRKRLVRQSPTPELRSIKYIRAPQCTGPDNICVLWVNDVFQWLYNDLVILNELLVIWIDSMNDYMRKTFIEEGVDMEIVRILPETSIPTLSNIFAENDSKDDVRITCDCDATPAFQLKAICQKGDKTEVSHYRANVNRFRARLNIFCISEKLQANVKCDGWPEIKIALAPVGNIKLNINENYLQEVINEMLINALRNFEVNLNLMQYPTCPKLIRHVPTSDNMYPRMSKMTAFPSNNYTNGTLMGKRLLVKVIRATDLRGVPESVEPYCIIEVDEPPQKNQTSTKKKTNSPFWDEHFLFDLQSNTMEILFEIYDHTTNPHTFLGLGIVGVEELLINPSQRQIISLQSRPYEKDIVSGTLTVEFLFIEEADISNLEDSHFYKIKESIRMVPTLKKTTNGFYTFGNESPSSKPTIQIDQNSSYPNKDTLIIHSVQRHPSKRLVKVTLSDGTWKEIERVEIDESKIDENKSEIEDKLSLNNIDSNDVVNDDHKEMGTLENQNPSKLPEEKPAEPPPPQTNDKVEVQTVVEETRSRPRRRRDFFGSIKRKLGKSKNRSKSNGPYDIKRDNSLNRSISADRSQNDGGGVGSGLKSLEQTSRRSSLSEASGLSSASARTYINEASTLVLETLENGIKKHYLVPLSLAQRSKWKKKGVKLHVFNDHTFIAKHFTRSIVCQVCNKNITRRIGKQGYECRDCLLKCHKHCHVKVNDICPNSTIHNIELSMLPVLSE